MVGWWVGGRMEGEEIEREKDGGEIVGGWS